MATVFATPTSSAHNPITIPSRRWTCKGIQCVVEDRYSTEVVTINGDTITCTCGMEETYSITCPHILAVKRQEACYALEAQQRDAYCAAFEIYA